MIVRLKSEHHYFETKLHEVESALNRDNDIQSATKIISGLSNFIIHHAVEEEARLLRVIMHKAKNEFFESIKIMQENNWVINFFKK
jgi:hypothetical protein